MVLKVFLSSTSKDLDPFRKAVDTAIHRLKDLHCVRMENWTARPDTPRAVCEAQVRESQLFIGILGHCYGSRPPDDERSFTEIEYDTAVAEGLPRLRPVQLDPMKLPTAVSLLREILGDAAPDEPTLERLALACGRLPLALRAAGTFLLTYSWPVEAYLAVLHEQRLALLSRVSADDPELDVRAVLTFSYDRLAEEAEDLAQRFTQLAVFPADFLADAAAAVWELSSVEAQTALDGLLARSLLQFAGELRRYRLHDLLRDLAREKADPPILGEAEQRHAEHYLVVLSMTQDLYLAGADKLLEALRLFDAERTNIEAGQAWAATRVATNNDAAWLAFEYTNAGVYVPPLRLTLQQQIHWLEIALVGCRRTGNRRGEGGVLGNLGNAWNTFGDARQAIACHEQALAIARENGDREAEGSHLGNLGVTWLVLRSAWKAIEYSEPV